VPELGREGTNSLVKAVVSRARSVRVLSSTSSTRVIGGETRTARQGNLEVSATHASPPAGGAAPGAAVVVGAVVSTGADTGEMRGGGISGGAASSLQNDSLLD
jgi:hypothetical protein